MTNNQWQILNELLESRPWSKLYSAEEIRHRKDIYLQHADHSCSDFDEYLKEIESNEDGQPTFFDRVYFK